MTSKTSRWPDPLAFACAVAGLTISAWMWHSYSDPTAATCSTGGCDVARGSAFAQWGPLSTPAIGVLGFGALATLLLLPRLRRHAPLLGALGATVGLGFVAVQAWVIGAWCPMCLTADLCAVVGGLAATRIDAHAPKAIRWRPALATAGTGFVAASVVALALAPEPAPAPRVVNAERAQAGEPLAIVEFVDFECPFCRRQHAQLKTLLAEYGDRVAVQRRHLPLPMHPHARDAARVACCAEEQDVGDAVADALMTSDDLSYQGCLRCAEAGGAQADLLAACLESPRPDARLSADADAANKQGIRSLPTCIVDGHAYEGLQDVTVLRAAIDGALASVRGRATGPT